MPITIDELLAKRRSLAVRWEGETINIVFRPYTDAGADAPMGEDRVYAELAATILEWDITEDGQMFQVDAENMRRLPKALLIEIQHSLIRDMYPNLRSGGASVPASAAIS